MGNGGIIASFGPADVDLGAGVRFWKNVYRSCKRWLPGDSHGHSRRMPIDFLKAEDVPDFDVDAIITNPPYARAYEFIEHALKLMNPNGVVAMLLRTDFDHAKTRQHLFAGCHAFAKKLVLTKRIQWFADSKGQPSFNHAWFIWDWKHKGPPILAYGP